MKYSKFRKTSDTVACSKSLQLKAKFDEEESDDASHLKLSFHENKCINETITS